MARRSTEDVISVVARDLFVRGRPVASPLTQTRSYGRVRLEVELTAHEERVDYAYRRFSQVRRTEEYSSTVHISWTIPNYGGRRPWLHCTDPECGRRVGRLFLSGKYLVCRGCAHVFYPSHLRQNLYERHVERATRIRTQLGGRPEVMAPVPGRPKGMHQTTYVRLCKELGKLHDLFDARTDAAIARGELSSEERMKEQVRRLLRDSSD